MSVWHRPHIALVMKKSAGIVPPTLVPADEGKNGLVGPPPSPSIASGGSIGFTIRYRACHCSVAIDLAITGTTTAKQAQATPTDARRRARADAALAARSPS